MNADLYPHIWLFRAWAAWWSAVLPREQALSLATAILNAALELPEDDAEVGA